MQIDELMEKHKELLMGEGSWMLTLLMIVIPTRKTINIEKIDLLLTKIENGELNEDVVNQWLEETK